MKRVCSQLCPHFQAALDVIARPWSGLILATLADGPVRFCGLLERLDAIGDRMLSCRLKELEAHGLVERSVIAGPPMRVEYALTDTGRGFGDVVRALESWGKTLVERVVEHPVLVPDEPCPGTK